MLPTDPESRRRKKTAIRIGQLATVMMLTFAAAGRAVADKRQSPLWPQGVELNLRQLCRMRFWLLYGLRTTVHWMLWEHADGPHGQWPPASGAQAYYFVVQFGLAGLICLLAGREGGTLLEWLVLLPPVVLSVFRLRRSGIVLVTGTSMAILIALNWWHGRTPVTNGWLDFSCALLFALLFPALAVTSEKARGEVERLAGELSAANQKLREYAVQNEELAVTRERNRLAREIHDTLGHYLTVVNIQLEAARALQSTDPVRLADALNKRPKGLAQKGLRDIRLSVATLRAPTPDDQPLAETLRQLVSQGDTSGLAVEMEVLGEPRPISPQARLSLYRAGQEGLTNVRKHARVASAQLLLDFRSVAKVSLSVTDHGVGAPNGAAASGSFGLLGLRERAHLLGGTVRVETAPGAGFTMVMEVPE